MTFCIKNAVSINGRDCSLALNGSKVQCELESELPPVFRVTVGETITIPPNTEIIVQGKIINDSFSCAQVIVEPTDSRLSERGILVAKSLVDVQTGVLPLRLANISDDPQKIYSGTLAAKCEPVKVITSDVMAHSQNSGTSESVTHSQNSGTIESVTHSQKCGADECMGTFPNYGRSDSVTDEQWAILVHLGDLFELSKTILSETEAETLSSLLAKHADAFSKYKGDIGRCSLVEHRIHTANDFPIKQAPRRLPLLKHETATAEIKRMLE